MIYCLFCGRAREHGVECRGCGAPDREIARVCEQLSPPPPPAGRYMTEEEVAAGFQRMLCPSAATSAIGSKWDAIRTPPIRK